MEANPVDDSIANRSGDAKPDSSLFGHMSSIPSSPDPRRSNSDLPMQFGLVEETAKVANRLTPKSRPRPKSETKAMSEDFTASGPWCRYAKCYSPHEVDCINEVDLRTKPKEKLPIREKNPIEEPDFFDNSFELSEAIRNNVNQPMKLMQREVYKSSTFKNILRPVIPSKQAIVQPQEQEKGGINIKETTSKEKLKLSFLLSQSPSLLGQMNHQNRIQEEPDKEGDEKRARSVLKTPLRCTIVPCKPQDKDKEQDKNKASSPGDVMQEYGRSPKKPYRGNLAFGQYSSAQINRIKAKNEQLRPILKPEQSYLQQRLGQKPKVKFRKNDEVFSITPINRTKKIQVC